MANPGQVRVFGPLQQRGHKGDLVQSATVVTEQMLSKDTVGPPSELCRGLAFHAVAD